jgi:hypothetical protein
MREKSLRRRGLAWKLTSFDKNFKGESFVLSLFLGLRSMPTPRQQLWVELSFFIVHLLDLGDSSYRHVE